MNCEKNYNHPFSRVRAYALYKRFCIFAVTSVTAPYVNIFVSTHCSYCDIFFNNRVFRVLYIRLTRQQKTRSIFLHFAKFLPLFSPISSLGVTLVTAKKTTSLLECARYTYAREKRSIRCSLFSCFAPLSSSLRFCADTKLQSDHFDKLNYQIRCRHKIKCQFFAVFSLFGAISPHIDIGAHDGGAHHFPFSFTAKANLKYKIQVALEPQSSSSHPLNCLRSAKYCWSNHSYLLEVSSLRTFL